MQSLANMGLVSISHGERARVQELTAQSIIRQVDLSAHIMLQRSSDSLEHLKSARLFFERGMVREAAAKATPEDVAKLRAIVDGAARAARQGGGIHGRRHALPHARSRRSPATRSSSR